MFKIYIYIYIILLKEDKNWRESLLIEDCFSITWISIKLAILLGSCYFCNFILSPVRDSVMERRYDIRIVH